MHKIKNEILNSKILIVEDDYLARVILKEIFKKQGFSNIEEAENGKEGLEKTIILRPDLIIMDVQMPEMDGIECCKNIRSQNAVAIQLHRSRHWLGDDPLRYHRTAHILLNQLILSAAEG